MEPEYRQDKTTQAACILLKKRDKPMSYLKLIKLLYLADRAALLKWGRPISFDAYVSMDQGPVLSRTYDLINHGPPPGPDSYWHQFISDPVRYKVSVKAECPDGALSEAEKRLLDQIYERFGQMGRWELVDWMHSNLQEWVDPHGSMIPLSYHDILVTGGGQTPAEAAVIEEEIEALAFADTIFR